MCEPGQIVELTNGVATSTFGATAGEWRCFSLTVPDTATDASFDVAKAVKGRGGDADLYVQHEALPDTARYDCRSVSNKSNESCAIDAPAAGEWYVGIFAYSSYPGVRLTGSSTDPDGSGGSGSVDADGDGYSPPEDCDDTDSHIHPGHNDTRGRWGRDGVDNDCNGEIDG